MEVDTPRTKLPWWRIIGPWQIQPGLLVFIGLLYYLTYQVGQLGSVPLLDPDPLVTRLIPGLISAIPIYLVARLGRFWQARVGVNWLNYLVTLIAMVAISQLARVIGLVRTDELSDAVSWVAPVRFLATFMLTSSIAGLIVRRLTLQVDATEEALRIAREQQVQIIQADEEARRQVALLLHDRVQAGLLSTNLELRALAKKLNPEESKQLNSLVERLESVREFDVRRAAHVLSPNLDDVDLQTALEDLAAQYEASFSVDIQLSPDIERDLLDHAPFTALAIYRIVDQALINVASHANATHVEVVIDYHESGFSLQIADNGRGIREPVTRGLGSTIITTWVRAVGGSWTLGNANSGSGVVLKAQLNRKESIATSN